MHQCTDPRDHILGILAQASDAKHDSPMQDDLHSLSVQERYLRFAKARLLEQRNLDVLVLAPHRFFSDVLVPWWFRPYYRWQMRQLSGFPSWVPNLRLHEMNELTSYTFRYGKFLVGGTETGTIEVINDEVPRCTGLVVDVVEDPGVILFDLPLPPVPARFPILPDKNKPNIVPNMLRSLDYYKRSLWKTMTCERAGLSDRIDVDTSKPFKDFLVRVDTLLVSEDLQEVETRGLSMKASIAIELSIQGGAIMRRIPRTAEGRLCAVPKEARVGDVICVLLGSAVPFVIRPTRRGMYKLIGEAYISDIMDGEALSGKYNQVNIMLE